MRIICPPVLVGDRICRIVSPIESLLEVEEWAGAWWEPSSVTLTTASLAPAATVADLEGRGVPTDGCEPGPRSAGQQIQALMRATVSASALSSAVDPANERRPNGTRRRVYTGNARFRRGGVESDEAPRRRATDELPPQERSAP